MEAQDGIPDIIVVRNFTVIKQDHIFQLNGIPDHTIVAYKGIAPDKRAVPDLRMLSDDTGASQICRTEYFGGFGNPYIRSRMIVDLLRKCGSELKNIIVDSSQCFPRICELLQIFFCDRLLKCKQILNPYLFNLTHIYFLLNPKTILHRIRQNH